jgi:hypothetical protein
LTSLKHHAHFHTKENHQCQECGRTFSHHWSLNAHMKVHKRRKQNMTVCLAQDQTNADRV